MIVFTRNFRNSYTIASKYESRQYKLASLYRTHKNSRSKISLLCLYFCVKLLSLLSLFSLFTLIYDTQTTNSGRIVSFSNHFTPKIINFF
jgi:hypothetical protein